MESAVLNREQTATYSLFSPLPFSEIGNRSPTAVSLTLLDTPVTKTLNHATVSCSCTGSQHTAEYAMQDKKHQYDIASIEERWKRDIEFFERVEQGTLNRKDVHGLLPDALISVGIVVFYFDKTAILYQSMTELYYNNDICMRQCGWDGNCFTAIHDNMVVLLLWTRNATIQQAKLTEYVKLLHQKYYLPILGHRSQICRTLSSVGQVLQKQLFEISANQYYNRTVWQEGGTEVTDIQLWEYYEKIEQMCEIRCFQKAMYAFKDFVQLAHRKRYPPTGVKTGTLKLAYLFCDNAEKYNCNIRKCSQDRLLMAATKILEAFSAIELEAAVERFCSLIADSEVLPPANLSEPIIQAAEFIRMHYSDSLRLSEVATMVHLNKSYLSQLFQKEMGVSYSQYLEHVRIEEAKKLLSTTNKTVAEIAEAVGFSGQNYFAKIFKSVVAVSPNKYRKGGAFA